jgi:cleavage and polyadenylation specificity factor subunit 2
MARIAVTEEVDGMRDEQDVDDPSTDVSSEKQATEEAKEDNNREEDEAQTGSMVVDEGSSSAQKKGRYIATSHEVHDAFDSVNVLRYQQPCHLGGMILSFYSYHPSAQRSSFR